MIATGHYISIKDGPAFDSEEVAENIRVEYDEQGELVGIEIFNITQIIANAIKKRIKEILKDIQH
jgi:uncharacterized protein YuzE